jgi:hypothetical protein
LAAVGVHQPAREDLLLQVVLAGLAAVVEAHLAAPLTLEALVVKALCCWCGLRGTKNEIRMD